MLNARISTNGETVSVYGLKRDGAIKLQWHDWVSLTCAAVKAVRFAMTHKADELSPTEWQDAREGHDWLEANGVTCLDDFLALESRTHLLMQPPDASRIVHCRRCERPLSDRLSVALGIGPSCRQHNYKIYTTTVRAVAREKHMIREDARRVMEA